MSLLCPVPIWSHFHNVWTASYTIKVTIKCVWQGETKQKQIMGGTAGSL